MVLEEKTIHFKKMKQLISASADVNGFKSNLPFTPLHLAAVFKSPELIEFLLLNGADSNPLTNKSLFFSFLLDQRAPWAQSAIDKEVMQYCLNKDKVIPEYLYTIDKSFSFRSYPQIFESALKKKRDHQEEQYIAQTFVTANLIHNESNPMAEVNRNSLLLIFNFLGKKTNLDTIEKTKQFSCIQTTKQSTSAKLPFFDKSIATPEMGEEVIIKTDKDFSEVILRSIHKI